MVLVVGSTGLLGFSVAMKLAAARQDVTAFLRDSSSERAKNLEAVGARILTGDLKDRGSVEDAVREADAVICTASSTLSRREGDSIETVDLAGVQGLVEAAAASGVRRFVFVSISPNMGEDFPLASAKRAAEKRLHDSSLDYVVLQPSYFSEVWFSPAVGFDVARGVVRVYGDGDAKISYISSADVTSAVVNAMDTAEIGRKTIPIGGVQAISQLDAIDIAARASRRQLRVDRMDLDQIRALRAGTADPMQASFFALFEHLALGDVIPSAWADLMAVRPIPVENWLERRFGREAE